MKNFNQHLTESRRSLILRALLESNGYCAGESMLDVFLYSCGHKISADQLRADLAWLAEMGLIGLRAVEGGHMQFAILTRRGQDAAQDRATVPGVARPSAEM